MGTALGSRDRLAVDGLMEPGQPAARGSGNVSLRSLPPGCAPLAVCWGRPDAGARSRPHLCHAPAVHRSAARRWQALPLAADRRCRCCRCLEPLQACAATTDRVEGTVQLQAAPQGRPQAREIQRGSCCAAKRGGRRRWPCISVAAEAGCAPGCKSPLALRETFLSLARPGAPALAPGARPAATPAAVGTAMPQPGELPAAKSGRNPAALRHGRAKADTLALLLLPFPAQVHLRHPRSLPAPQRAPCRRRCPPPPPPLQPPPLPTLLPPSSWPRPPAAAARTRAAPSPRLRLM